MTCTLKKNFLWKNVYGLVDEDNKGFETALDCHNMHLDEELLVIEPLDDLVDEDDKGVITAIVQNSTQIGQTRHEKYYLVPQRHTL